ncbi:NADH-quinone oxidoreductase subunit C [Geoalkalibacter halelectricus]|uniref:NADH-quinone oxidoreductase n=1 Tax=Geoalkalibacter halelectricus TaxID=2847045 RepID=A0ABY5ZLL4_9BACT|nr:NADH-quinone oxidoreductase subunit C [Geoalkalibacter halelectricus]MDO3378636.1 NADH-quinone oxidoreductase subunit C [Geoalkalibacter halelectricus]UWZ80052.1 NADH-quinone oxidoreductase subunit C [Geoalkalibacter halelectricus]
MESRDSVIAALEGLPAKVEAVDFSRRGYHLEVFVTSERLRDFAELLRTGDFYLSFISGLHVKPALEVSYQFANYGFPCRLLARVSVDEDGSLPTISDIFQGADWHERETKDFFGVVFRGHPNLKPLLLAEDMEDLKPLLKKDEKLKERAAVTRVEALAEEKSPAPAAGEEGP